MLVVRSLSNRLRRSSGLLIVESFRGKNNPRMPLPEFPRFSSGGQFLDEDKIKSAHQEMWEEDSTRPLYLDAQVRILKDDAVLQD